MKIIEGNLLDCPEGINIIAHGCNCFHTMGAGIARQIKERYPEAYQADKETSYGLKSKLGTFSYAKSGFIKIANLYTQFNCGGQRELNYEALYNCLVNLRDAINHGSNSNSYVLGLPFLIGCGLAGGDARIVKTMHDVIFEEAKFEVIIVKYKQ